MDINHVIMCFHVFWNEVDGPEPQFFVKTIWRLDFNMVSLYMMEYNIYLS